jgi:hypothetical protein
VLTQEAGGVNKVVDVGRDGGVGELAAARAQADEVEPQDSDAFSDEAAGDS